MPSDFFSSVAQCFREPRVRIGLMTLVAVSIFLGLFSFQVFPLGVVDFIFFSILLLLLALYRPNWVFLALVGTLPLEILSVWSSESGVMLRPYQWCAIALTLALGIRVMSGRTKWQLFQVHPLDLLLLLVPVGAFVSGILSGGEGLRLAVIVSSFGLLYILGRIFFHKPGDVRQAGFVFLLSGLLVTLYGLFQNVAFLLGRESGEVMPGRPNALFAEPDWFGLALVFWVALTLFFLEKKLATAEDTKATFVSKVFLAWFLLVPFLTVLIMTVSRSAWLSCFFLVLTFLLVPLVSSYRTKLLRRTLHIAQLFMIAAITALLLVVDIPLTRFDLFNRAQSTATGLQEITVACVRPETLPREISSVDELTPFGCRHIDLEEIESLRAAGQSIQTVFRPDPNVVIRAEIYGKAWETALTHPVLGIGWGNIGVILGTDERGASFNASNLWLELWLGAGLLGLFGFLSFVIWSLGALFLAAFKEKESLGLERVLCALFIAYLVFNLFNAGMLIGFIWVFWATLPMFVKNPFHTKTVL